MTERTGARPPEPAPPLADTAARRPGRMPVVIGVLAACAQVGVLLFTALLGLQWGGWSYAAALGQASGLCVVAAVLASRRSWWVLAVPVVSVAASIALLVIGTTADAATACDPGALQRAASVDPLPGTSPRLEGEAVNGCIARFTTDAPPERVIAHYRDEFEQGGWTLVTDDPLLLVARSGSTVMNVEVVPAEGGLVIIGLSQD